MRWAAALSDRRLGLSRRRVPLLLQQERAECGLAALGMIAAYHGKALTLAALRRRLGGWPRGMTVADLVAAAERLELVARPLRLSLAELGRLRLPAILHWRFDHFVVVTAAGRRGVVVHDPARGRRRIRRAELDDAFTGVAVELVPAPRFRPCREGAELSLVDLLKSIDGIGRYLGTVLFLLLVTQVLTLVPPVATQLLIDEVVLGQDRAWLMAALGGLGLVMLAGVVLETLRRWLGVYAGTRIAADCTVGVVRHLLRLPTSFLRERHLGDLMSKLGSLAPIRRALTETGLNGLAQLAVLVSTVAIMCYYSVSLAAVSVGGWLLSAAAAVAVLPASRRHAEQAVVHGARQDSSLLETLRAAEVVRALGLGGRRLADWQDHFYASTNARVAQAKLTVISRGCADAVLALEQLAFLAVGITGLVEQRLTLGALFAFLTLRNRLGAAAGTLLAAASSLYLTRVHTRRLSDIALAPAPAAPRGGAVRRVRGHLSARSLAFRYAQGPWILEGFDCEIPAGAVAVITGPSGCGKTTLLRLLAGAEVADEGCVALDGLELALWDTGHLRRQVGTVLQQDALFKGTIADNISGFEPSVDAVRMRQAAVLADIWTDIRSMPLAHRTPVGDMGSTLSGGQRQRIVLARALYRMPRLLFLDEATSHLDVATERRIMDRLARLGITIVSVAHRPDVMRRATHVIALGPHDAGQEPAP